MGTVSATEIQKAADRLLRILVEQGRLRYSTDYYDRSDEQEEQLCDEMQIDGRGTTPAVLIDLAVCQRENIEGVEKEELDQVLADGETDYTTELTPDGKTALATGARFEADHEVL